MECRLPWFFLPVKYYIYTGPKNLGKVLRCLLGSDGGRYICLHANKIGQNTPQKKCHKAIGTRFGSNGVVSMAIYVA